MVIQGKAITGKYPFMNKVNFCSTNTTISMLPKYDHRLTSIDSKSNAQIFEPNHETTNNK